MAAVSSVAFMRLTFNHKKIWTKKFGHNVLPTLVILEADFFVITLRQGYVTLLQHRPHVILVSSYRDSYSHIIIHNKYHWRLDQYVIRFSSYSTYRHISFAYMIYHDIIFTWDGAQGRLDQFAELKAHSAASAQASEWTWYLGYCIWYLKIVSKNCFFGCCI